MDRTSQASVDQAIGAIRSGHMVIVVDDQQRENEGDLVMAGSLVTPAAINFMARFGRGLICVPMTHERLKDLGLPPMTPSPEDSMRTDFTISVDARLGTTTGISAGDRAKTIQVLADPSSQADDLVRPGHVFPLRAKEGGVLRRAGHTEAAIDLVRLAGLNPVAAICEIMNDDGTMARRPDLVGFAKDHDLLIISIADLIRYRVARETVVFREDQAHLPTRHGAFEAYAYSEANGNLPHLALVRGEIDPSQDDPVLVRLHSECLTGDTLGSLRCDCGEQLEQALDLIASQGRGVLVYLRQEGRGIGLANKIRSYALQDRGFDTVSANLALGFPADLRDYGIGARILLDLGIRRVRLLTNNPEKLSALKQYGLDVVERIPLQIASRPENERYLETKRTQMGHWLTPNAEAHPKDPSTDSQPVPVSQPVSGGV
ncbi:MAG: bifunctional 3,4-dihydroxy-2-butanone-4-phosphate synthase/GTP cyclohydrolase II [Firmicutes bacterium]|nr:bifunctional 3,4-dihydroxy-2-butanone-4-phosphate synthase/GTP cyclohydrolase II [Bacillota bacterium]MCL5065589.1 bifunctional 3,4-dihydroxy-2-butanone-4-phosphate synthase/GTP cyclohydrolase II [Bacillota bacterium]